MPQTLTGGLLKAGDRSLNFVCRVSMGSRPLVSWGVLKGVGGLASFVGTIVGILAACGVVPFGGTENALAAAATAVFVATSPAVPVTG